MHRRSWDQFLTFLYELPSQLRPGRQQIRVVRDSLERLVAEKVRPGLTDDDERALFPLGFSPAESDLKIAAGVGLERGLVTAQEYEAALRSDIAASPFGFLQTLSGKTFGETVTPLIVRYWLLDAGDTFQKQSTRALYDVAWAPHETGQALRIELKTSSEALPNFQQIRHPRMSSASDAPPDYDVLLCLGISNDGPEWWMFPASSVEQFIETSVFPPQHGGTKMASGTYWVRMNQDNCRAFKSFAVTSDDLRSSLLALTVRQ